MRTQGFVHGIFLIFFISVVIFGEIAVAGIVNQDLIADIGSINHPFVKRIQNTGAGGLAVDEIFYLAVNKAKMIFQYLHHGIAIADTAAQVRYPGMLIIVNANDQGTFCRMNRHHGNTRKQDKNK